MKEIIRTWMAHKWFATTVSVIVSFLVLLILLLALCIFAATCFHASLVEGWLSVMGGGLWAGIIRLSAFILSFVLTTIAFRSPKP